ncbi:MAG TPA: hypothetical protein VF721_20625 [Pyrinomonadaceae bacterium]|jgi:hypothetical protein
MAKKLTIKGITFPDFGDDKSKKNFRLVFYIGYTDKDGKANVAVISKPASGHWQWRSANKDAYLKPKIVGDSAVLDTLVLQMGDGKKIAPGSDSIGEIDGEITGVNVQFMDVHDSTLVDFFVKTVLPDLINAWKTSGLNPIDSAPIPGGIKILLKDKIDLAQLADKSVAFFTKKLKDKVLNSISQTYNGGTEIDLTEKDVPWGNKGKKGTYAVTIGVA